MLVFFSSYEGWDYPFRPEGEISHDADELLRLWRKGQQVESKTEILAERSEDVSTEEAGDTLEMDAKSPLLGHQNGGCQTNGNLATFEVKQEMLKASPSTLAQTVTIGGGKEESPTLPKKKSGGCCTLM